MRAVSIRSRLTILFLAIASIPLLFVSALTFTHYKNSLETARIANLENIAASKADKIESYFAGLKNNIEVAQGYYNIKKNLPILVRLVDKPNDPRFVAADKMLDGQLQQMQSVLGLVDIMLANSEGKIVYASKAERRPKTILNPLPDPHQMAFSEGKNRVSYSDVFLSDAEGNRPAMLVTAPAVGFNGAFIGVIAFEVDMKFIYKIIQEVTGLGATGEVLVGKKKGKEVVYLNPLRHDPDAALKRKVLLGGKQGGPIQEAVQGRNGASRYLDYRGEDVIAAWRHLPVLDWGIVAKIDTGEAFADATKLRNLVLVIVVIVFLLCGIIAFSIARSISVPIKNLSQGAEIIGSGNLDYKIGSHRKDEIGQLSRTFDKMTEDLKKITASREELNRENEERKRAEKEILKLNEDLKYHVVQLEESNRELDAFSYSVSHDLRSPLRHMAGFMELLQKRTWPQMDETNRHYMTVISESSKRMGMLIDDLLAFSRIGRSEMRTMPIRVEKLVQEAIGEHREETKGRDIAWKIGELPDIYGDPSLLRLVLVNLVSNALKFTRTRPRAEIEIGCTEEENEFFFFIRDNGVGFDMTYAEKLFGVFHRLHHRDEFEGTGIGLANVRRIISRHGGRAWATGSLDHGATFYFSLSKTRKA
jgi:signal transduction histidine kinase